MVRRRGAKVPLGAILFGFLIWMGLSALGIVDGPLSGHRVPRSETDEPFGRGGTEPAGPGPVHSAPELTQSFSATVVHVGDGDSISVQSDHGLIRIRLHGIDCPELSQPFGRLARDITMEICLRRLVQVVPRERDHYDRLVAEVFVNGESLNQALLARGAAWLYRQHENSPQWSDLEYAAKTRRLGLWNSEHPVPPWQWRQTHTRPHVPLPANRQPDARR